MAEGFVDAVTKFSGDVTLLGRAEAFFLSVSRVPRLSSRLDSFVFSLQFNETVGELQSKAMILAQASSEVFLNDPRSHDLFVVPTQHRYPNNMGMVTAVLESFNR